MLFSHGYQLHFILESLQLGDVTVAMDTGKLARNSSSKIKAKASKVKIVPQKSLQGNLQQNKDRKKAFKNMKKDRKRAGYLEFYLKFYSMSLRYSITGQLISP